LGNFLNVGDDLFDPVSRFQWNQYVSSHDVFLSFPSASFAQSNEQAMCQSRKIGTGSK
jgi:hypothetical protein